MSVQCLDSHHTLRDRIRQEPVLAALRETSGVRSTDPETRRRLMLDKAQYLRGVAEDIILDETRQTVLALACRYEQLARLEKPAVSCS